MKGFANKVADRIFTEYIDLLGLEYAMDRADSVIERLEKFYPPAQTMKLVGFLGYLNEYGRDFYKLPFLKFGRTTYWRALKDCKQAGVLFFE